MGFSSRRWSSVRMKEQGLKPTDCNAAIRATYEKARGMSSLSG
jgi:hypothetical protein